MKCALPLLALVLLCVPASGREEFVDMTTFGTFICPDFSSPIVERRADGTLCEEVCTELVLDPRCKPPEPGDLGIACDFLVGCAWSCTQWTRTCSEPDAD